MNKVASRNIKVLVVGNPANTNAYIAMKSAPGLPARNFTAMLRLDHNRALSQLASKAGVAVGDIENLIVWGNHSPVSYTHLDVYKRQVFGKVIEGLEVVDSVAGGDAINSVKIEGDASALLAAKADRVTEWNRHLSA